MDIWGWGRKNTADVNEKGQILTYAESFSTAYDAAKEGDAYTLDIDGVAIGAEGNTLVMMENSHSSKEMIVTHFHLRPSTTNEDQEIEVYIGGAFTYGEEGAAVLPTNVHSDKSGGAPGGVTKSFYVTDTTADTLTAITAGVIVSRFAMPDDVPYTCSISSRWHITPGNCFYLQATQIAVFKGFISFYYR